MNYIDIHSHYKIERPDVFSFIGISREQLKPFLKGEAFSKNTTFGIHPWWVDELSDEEVDAFFKKLESGTFLAIGECGLDRMRGDDFERQRTIFKRHYDLNNETPLIIHNVRASSDFFNIIGPKNERKIILHDYQGSVQETKEWLKRGAYFSYGKKLLNGKMSKALESLDIIPLERLFLETDDMNAKIDEVYFAFSIRQNISLDQLSEQIEKNFKDVFLKNVQELLDDQ